MTQLEAMVTIQTSLRKVDLHVSMLHRITLLLLRPLK